MSLAIRRNAFCKFFDANNAILELVERKWTQKYATFGQVDTRVLTILGAKKSIFGTSEIF